MSRLTRYHQESLLTDEGGYYEPNASNYYDIVVKLGQIEDLEDELGCPLEVVFKALKDTYIWIIHKDKTDYSVDFCLENYSGKWYISSYDKAELYLCKDYKKTWFLKGDLSE